MQRIIHNIYGAGTVLRPAKGVFWWVRFDNDTNCGTRELAVSMNVCRRL